VKQYFPEDAVLAACSAWSNALRRARCAGERAAWHEDVRFFDLRDARAAGRPVYMDLYARETKRGGAWMATRARGGGAARPSRRRWRISTAISASRRRKPALFTHDDVITLFTSSGTACTTCSRASGARVSASRVEWDAVELRASS